MLYRQRPLNGQQQPYLYYIAYETDTNKFKIGNGTALYSALPYSVTVSNIASPTGGMVYRGIFDTTGATTYAVGDVVEFNTSSYVCIVATSSSPTTTPSDWQLIGGITINQDGVAVGTATTINLISGSGISGTLSNSNLELVVSSNGTLPFGNIGTIPNISNLTWVNQNSATALQSGGPNTPILITIPYNSNTSSVNILTEPLASTTTCTVIGWFRGNPTNNNTYSAIGMWLHDSVANKLLGVSLYTTSGSPGVQVSKFTIGTSNLAAFGAQGFDWGFGGGPFCIKLDIHSGTITCSISYDGYNFITLYTEAVGSFLTPDNWSYGGLNSYNSAFPLAWISLMGRTNTAI